MFSSGKTCVVCQAPAHSVNYGALTCEACRSFFRRANRNTAYKHFRCFHGFQCNIDEGNRKKSCPYCRFQRCLKEGMNIDALNSGQKRYSQKPRGPETTEDPSNRHRMTVATLRQSEAPAPRPHCFMPKVGDLSKHFSMIELFDLDGLWSRYSHSFHHIPINEETKNAVDPYATYDGFLNVLSALGKRFLLFADSVPDFNEFSISDRKTLFLGAISELCMVNCCLIFNQDEDLWFTRIAENSKFYGNLPGMKAETKIKYFGPDLYRDKLKIILDIQRCRPDEITIMLMFCILLFSPARVGLKDTELALKKQSYFATLLLKYLLWGSGEVNGRRVFDTLLSKLKDFRRMGSLIYKRLHGPMLQQPKYNFLSDVFPNTM